VIQPQFADRYVFFDPPAKQLVLHYPENLGQSDFASNPGNQKTERIDLYDKVQGSVVVSVKRQGASFVYAYRIANGSGAKQPIKRLDLASQGGLSDVRMSAPPRWATALEPALTNAASMLALGTPLGGRMGWQVVGQQGIAPGGELAGFQLTSALQPGITLVQFGSGAQPALRGDLPHAVREQAAPIMKPGQNLQTVYTIGPLYSAEAHTLQKVADFYTSLSRMVRSGTLDGQSPAIAEATQVLERYLQVSQQAQGVVLEDFVGPPLAFTAVARPGLETQVQDALKMSLK
jgi:hypothetical protein